MDTVSKIAQKAKLNSPVIGSAGTDIKNRALAEIASSLLKHKEDIVKANADDIKRARHAGISESLIDRLALDSKRILKISQSIREVIDMTDPLGSVIFGYNLPNGLILKNIRAPFGVIGIIYEARPNVTVDAAVLCLKAGSAVILRGSSHALQSNKVLTDIMRQAVEKNGLPADIIQIIPSASREDADKLMQLRQYIDVLIPRGGKELINRVVSESKVPVIETGIGNCHVYIDNKLDRVTLDSIIQIVLNSKTQRPSVCNAAEKLLVHQDVAQRILPGVLDSLKAKNVRIKGCRQTMAIYPWAEAATEDDWYEEYLDLIISVKVVKNIKDAVKHINKYGSHHTESIITSDYENSIYFTSQCDSSTVFVNASTRFTDGGEFGLGAEIGISTQKLHWRGPMSLQQLTTNKFVVFGSGQIRK
ncbi:MAG: glutamate-5-semialdehyde dehydrogenase [Actinobacteria bacterium]|nr:glutamate-5-semialdehyde dehydrogenase [Actinomycetota bacterium]